MVCILVLTHVQSNRTCTRVYLDTHTHLLCNINNGMIVTNKIDVAGVFLFG